MLALGLGLSLVGLVPACESKTTGDGLGGGDATKSGDTVRWTVRGASPLPDDAHEALKRWVDNAARAALAESALEVREHGDVAWRGELLFEVVPVPESAAVPEDGNARLVMHLSLRLDGADAYGPRRVIAETWSGVAAQDDERDGQLLMRAASIGFEHLSRQVARQLRVLRADEAGLAAILSAPEVDLLRWAMHEVRRRDARPLLGLVRAALMHPERDIAFIAMAVLGQMGDADSVAALSDMCTSADGEKVLHAIDALGSIGGAEAEELLRQMTVAEVPEPFRSHAREAYERARRRRAPPGSP